jgi:polar amino acid transport system substrate-binding protein
VIHPSAEVLAELAPGGTLRVAINYGNPVLAHPDPATGEPAGVSVDLARELARRLGVPVRFVTFDAAGKVVAALAGGAWDVAFLARDPARATEILFTSPYVIIEGTYLVRDAAPFRAVEELDRPGVRIAVGKGAAYDLFLTRTLRHATLVRSDTSAGAVDLFLHANLDAAAGVKNPLAAFARSHPGVRVIEGRFTAIEQAVATPRPRAAAGRWLEGFIEAMKASGFVADALRRSGQTDATVAPPASSTSGPRRTTGRGTSSAPAAPRARRRNRGRRPSRGGPAPCPPTAGRLPGARDVEDARVRPYGRLTWSFPPGASPSWSPSSRRCCRPLQPARAPCAAAGIPSSRRATRRRSRGSSGSSSTPRSCG